MFKEGTKVNSTKIKFVLDLTPPINPKKIRIFLGHIDYYCKFIQHYSDITFPMDTFLRLDVEFKWNQECEESFELLKKKLVKDPILRFLH